MESNFKVNMNEYLPLRDVVFNTLNPDPRGNQKTGAGRPGTDDSKKRS